MAEPAFANAAGFLQMLGRVTWKLPAWLDARLPEFNIEGSSPALAPIVPDAGRTPTRHAGAGTLAGREPEPTTGS
jgi:hypothetical protein